MSEDRAVARALDTTAAPPGDNDADAQLAIAVREGQPGAAEELWRTYGPVVYRLIRRSFDTNDAEDLTQEVFLRLFSVIHKLEQPAALRSFIVSIAFRVMKWQARRRWIRRIVTPFSSTVVPDVAGNQVDPVARDAARRLIVLLDEFSFRDRQVFILRHMEELRLEEVAEALSISLGTVKRALKRTTTQLAAYIDGDPTLAGFLKGNISGERDEG